MGEKGNVTADELSASMAGGATAVTAVGGQAGDAVTTVVSGGGTTVVTAASLGEKIVDKTIGLGGDEIQQKLRETRKRSRARPDDGPAAGNASATDPAPERS